MNYPFPNPTIPERLHSNEELMQIIKNAIKKEKESRKEKDADKAKIISAKDFFQSKLFNRG